MRLHGLLIAITLIGVTEELQIPKFNASIQTRHKFLLVKILKRKVKSILL